MITSQWELLNDPKWSGSNLKSNQDFPLRIADFLTSTCECDPLCLQIVSDFLVSDFFESQDHLFQRFKIILHYLEIMWLIDSPDYGEERVLKNNFRANSLRTFSKTCLNLPGRIDSVAQVREADHLWFFRSLSVSPNKLNFLKFWQLRNFSKWNILQLLDSIDIDLSKFIELASIQKNVSVYWNEPFFLINTAFHRKKALLPWNRRFSGYRTSLSLSFSLSLRTS